MSENYFEKLFGKPLKRTGTVGVATLPLTFYIGRDTLEIFVEAVTQSQARQN